MTKREPKLFFIADPHFHHENSVKFFRGHRFSSLQEMEDTLVHHWNTKVEEQDLVIVAGDFSFGHKKEISDVLERLNGRKCLIKGNHDKLTQKTYEDLFEWVKDIYKMTVKVSLPSGETTSRRIVISHYPMAAWPESFHGSWLICGHTHGMMRESLPTTLDHGLLLDVGVDVWGYAPVSLEEVAKTMMAKEKAIRETGNKFSDYRNTEWISGGEALREQVQAFSSAREKHILSLG